MTKEILMTNQPRRFLMLSNDLVSTKNHALYSASVFTQQLPSTFPKQPQGRFGVGSGSSGEIRVFHLEGKTYRAKITQFQINEGPDWRPSIPLPLAFTKAEEIARSELHKLLPDAVGWETVEIAVKRLSSSDEPKWFYLVRLAPPLEKAQRPGDSFYVLINFLGEPGLIEIDNSLGLQK